MGTQRAADYGTGVDLMYQSKAWVGVEWEPKEQLIMAHGVDLMYPCRAGRSIWVCNHKLYKKKNVSALIFKGCCFEVAKSLCLAFFEEKINLAMVSLSYFWGPWSNRKLGFWFIIWFAPWHIKRKLQKRSKLKIITLFTVRPVCGSWPAAGRRCLSQLPMAWC